MDDFRHYVGPFSLSFELAMLKGHEFARAVVYVGHLEGCPRYVRGKWRQVSSFVQGTFSIGNEDLTRRVLETIEEDYDEILKKQLEKL